MHRIISLFLLLLLFSACVAPEMEPGQTPDPPELAVKDTPQAEAPAEVSGIETKDRILLTLEAPLADGRTLTLEAFGRVLDEYTTGVREVRVYDGGALSQTVFAREGIVSEGLGRGGYTDCWSAEDCMDALDLNFDGNTDFGLFGWRCNNTIPYYYWTWDPEMEQYRFACILQGAEAHPESGETTAEYKSGSAGSQWVTEYYKPDENGDLYLDRWERLVLDFQPDSGYLDVDREGAREVWLPKKGDVPRPRPNDEWTQEDLVLARREVPVCQIGEDNTVSYFMEIWEFRDGEPSLVERKEYSYDNQQ